MQKISETIMKDIVGIYIINKNDEPVFIYEPRKKKNFDYDILFDTLITLDKMAGELEGDLKRVTLGEHVYFFIHETVTNYQFIFKCSTDMERNDISEFIYNLKEKFLVEFRGFRVIGKYKKKKMVKKFKKLVGKMIHKFIIDPEDLLRAL